MSPTGETTPESEEEHQKNLNEKQQDLLMMCISQDLGFVGGKPVAAFVIYKCLLHLRSFEIERTSVFDRILQIIVSDTEVHGGIDTLSYWLSNTSTLLTLLRHTLKASGTVTSTRRRRPSSLFGRISKGLRASPKSAGLSLPSRQMLGRYPAFLFNEQLTTFLERTYGMIRDKLKTEISPMIGLCVQPSIRSRQSLETLVRGRIQADDGLPWRSIIKSLNNYLKIMKANYVLPLLVQNIFTQIFSFINAQFFNSLLLRRECCSFSNGEYVKAGLAELEQWCCYATEEYVGSAWYELRYMRQAVGFLVIRQKPKKTLNEITNELCPVLSIQQLYRISTMYWDDKYGTHSVSSDVISNMRVMMAEDSNNSVSSSFLLDNDPSIPFSMDDLSKSMPQVDVADVEAPPLVYENSGVHVGIDTALIVANMPESEDQPQKSLNEKQQGNQDLLIKCISQDLGFSGGKPIAACVVYKCLLHWRLFEVERTSVFDRIIQTIASAIEAPDNNGVLSYWLSNASTLLVLLQQTFKASGAGSLFGRRSQSAGLSFLNGRMRGRLDELQQVEAKYPALFFKQQLAAFLEKIYVMTRDSLTKEISPLLGLCIQAPITSCASLVKGGAQANAVAQQALIIQWQSIVKSLNNSLNIMKANYVGPFLVRNIFTQMFSFINVQLFNSLLLQRECCSFSNGEFVKAGLAELEQWCCYATEEYGGSAWDELRHITQAVGFLVIHQKPKKSLNEITCELCTVLSIQQLYRISTMYWDDKYGTHSVSSDVISNMRVMMAEDSNNSPSDSFLLDNDSSIPFSVNNLSRSMPQVDIADVEAPPLIRENSGFVFLHQ